MRHIQRAAVTGLLAIWLAPLSAVGDSPSFQARRDARTPVPAIAASVEPPREKRPEMQDNDEA